MICNVGILVLLQFCMISFCRNHAREVNVYTPYPNTKTDEWVTAARSSITGVYPCCGGFSVHSDGSFVAKPAMNITYLRRLGLSVMPVLNIEQAAVQSFAGVKAAEGIAQTAYEQGYDGFICDYEPSTNYTLDHVKAYAAFVKATSDALHKKNLKFGMDIASWGILGHTDIYAKTGVDIMTSMTPTYYGTNIKENQEYVETTLKNAESNGQAEFGFGTMVVDESKAKWNYKWTNEKFTSFVQWCGDKGVQGFALWRADIDNPQPANGTESYYFEALTKFLHG